MGGICSSNPLKRFFRCQKCAAHRQKRQVEKEAENAERKQQVLRAFYALADDPMFISRSQFVEILGPTLGPFLWRYLQGEEARTMDFGQFTKHGKFLEEMALGHYAQIGMHPDKLLRACLECCEIGRADESPQDLDFLHKLAKEMGESPEEMVAWEERNCPRLFQSIHEHVLDKFLGIPKSTIEESILEESELISRTQMFFLKHNLPRAIYFEKSRPAEEEENAPEGGRRAAGEGAGTGTGAGWTKLYESQSQGLGPEKFEQNVFQFNGSTVSIFQMLSEEMFVLAVDEKWRNGPSPFGGPYTVLFRIRPEFQRIEKEPPALHCNLKEPSWSNSVFFNGGTILALKNDFSNAKAIEVWGCARLRERAEVPKVEGEGEDILERKKPKKEEGGKGRRRTAVERWEENPDKQLLEMAGFDNNRRRGGAKK